MIMLGHHDTIGMLPVEIGHDVSVIVEAADEVTMAAVAIAIAAGGAVKAAKTTPLLSGPQWVAALKKAPAVSAQYRAAR